MALRRAMNVLQYPSMQFTGATDEGPHGSRAR